MKGKEKEEDEMKAKVQSRKPQYDDKGHLVGVEICGNWYQYSATRDKWFSMDAHEYVSGYYVLCQLFLHK